MAGTGWTWERQNDFRISKYIYTGSNIRLWKVVFDNLYITIALSASAAAFAVFLTFRIVRSMRTLGRRAALLKSENESLAACLEASDRKLRGFLSTDLMGIVLWDADGLINDANDRFLQMIGYARDELEQGKIRWNTLTPPEYKARDEEALVQMRGSGYCIPFEKEYIHKDGHRVPVLIGVVPIDGVGERGICYVHDLSEIKALERRKKQLEEERQVAIEKSEELFRTVAKACTDVIWDMDLASGRIKWSAGIQDLLGYGDDGLTRGIEWWYDKIHPEDLTRIKESAEAFLASNTATWRGQYRLRRSDGAFVEVMDSAQGMFDSSGKRTRLIGALVDVTRQRAAEHEIAQQNNVLRLLHRISAAANESTSTTQVVSFCLASICAQWGWDVGHSIEISYDELNEAPRAGPQLWHIEGKSSCYETFVKESANLDFLGSYTLPSRAYHERAGVRWSAADDSFYPRQSLLKEVGFKSAFSFPVLLNDQVALILEFFSHVEKVVTGSEHQVTEQIGTQIARVVERERAREALSRSEEQLRQSQRMEAMGRLAGGIAHDFNNLLTVINGYSDMLLRRESQPAFRISVEEIRRAGARAASLTHKLLAFSRKQVLAPRVINLNSVVQDLVEMLRRLCGDDVSLHTHLAPTLSATRIDVSQIEQVIMNLVVNARDAMPKGGSITITTADVIVEGPSEERALSFSTRLKFHDCPPGRYVLLGVKDTGTGIADEVKRHLFEPFFTTKEVGKGTGLGLSTVYGIVEQSNGFLSVESTLGEGATFSIFLPQVDAPAEYQIDSRIMRAAPRGSETILLIEDEELVRSLVHEILITQGYHVIAAANGSEAQALYREHAATISLVLTDVVMPEMGGREVVEKLQADKPELKVLYMSGYTDDAIVHHGVLSSHTSFIAKPFSPDALARKIREVLDGKHVTEAVM